MKEQIMEAIKAAMKAGERQIVETLRLAVSALKDKEISLRAKADVEWSSQHALEALDAMIKQRLQSIEMYEQAARQDLADKEKAEIEIISKFLPTPMTEEEVKEALEATLKEVGAQSMKDMGKVVAVLRAQFTARMDFAKASEWLKKRLS